ncbi:hypothetical protein BCR32DRAFT_265684 [Anaeromyces robustus]|uniref:Uncharacterized protein n=1 Tax=Anaeromyces robustus TaxID=1754192 RepID=A0A1Y1XI14_9FUNG|nr:hypothetical protein BCR32DRAFT_265684 [Anaeromyces robustus]|eukprot:ORX85411.1 hypothetical protein BCR32DRAFT_265684 [Anaeromyces robustus]
MENDNPINSGSTEQLLTFAAEIGSSLLIQNRELEELNKTLSLKIDNLTNDNLSISNQYQELENINHSLRTRIQYLEEENEHIHNKLKFQIKEENNIKDNLFLQKENKIYQLSLEIEDKDNDIKKAKNKIKDLTDICQQQKEDILKLQEEHEESIKQNIVLERLKDEKKEYRNSLESLEIDYNRLDQENNDLKESLDKINEKMDEKSKIIANYNNINTNVLKELENIILSSMNIKEDKENSNSPTKIKKKEECLIFSINSNNLASENLNDDVNEMIKCFFDISKFKLISILYEEITNQELSEMNNETIVSSTSQRNHNNINISGNDDTVYSHSFDSDSVYATSIGENEVILDPNFDMNSLYTPISEKHSDLENNDDEGCDSMTHENIRKKNNSSYNENIMEEKEYLAKIYEEISKYIKNINSKDIKRISIPIFEKLKLNIRNTYLNLISIIVKSISIDKEKNKRNNDDSNDVVSSSWLIYPLSLQYFKLLIYIFDIENSIIKEITVNQTNDNKKMVKQLRDELNSIKRSSRDLEDKIKLSKLKRRSKNLNRLSQEFDNYNLKNLERQFYYNDTPFKDQNESEDESFKKFISDLIEKNENEEKLKKSKQIENNYNTKIYDNTIYENKKEENYDISIEKPSDDNSKTNNTDTIKMTNNKTSTTNINTEVDNTKPIEIKNNNIQLDNYKISSNDDKKDYSNEKVKTGSSNQNNKNDINVKDEKKQVDIGQEDIKQNEIKQNNINQDDTKQYEIMNNEIKQEKIKHVEINQGETIQEEIKQEEDKINGKEVKEEIKQEEDKIKQEEIKQEEMKQKEDKIKGEIKEEIKQEEDRINGEEVKEEIKQEKIKQEEDKIKPEKIKQEEIKHEEDKIKPEKIKQEEIKQEEDKINGEEVKEEIKQEEKKIKQEEIKQQEIKHEEIEKEEEKQEIIKQNTMFIKDNDNSKINQNINNKVEITTDKCDCDYELECNSLEDINNNNNIDSNECLCLKKNIGTQTEPVKEIQSDSFSIAEDEIIFGEYDKKLSPIINYQINGENENETNNKINNSEPMKVEKTEGQTNVKFIEENINSSKRNSILNTQKNIEENKTSSKRSSVSSIHKNNGEISSKVGSKRNSILSNAQNMEESNRNVNFSIKSKKLKKDNSNISKLILLFEGNDDDDDDDISEKHNASKQSDLKNLNKIESVKDRIKRFSGSSLNEDSNKSSRLSLLEDNYDFEGNSIEVINFNSTEQLNASEKDKKNKNDNDKNENKNGNGDKNENKDLNNSYAIINTKSNEKSIDNDDKDKRQASIEEMDEKISRILIDSDIFNLNNKVKTISNKSNNFSDYELKDILENDDDYDNVGFINSPFTSIPGIENVTRAMVGTWVKKLNRFKLYAKNRYLILHPFINAVSWSKYGPFSEPKKIHSEYVLEIRAKRTKTNDNILVIKTKTSKEVYIKFNSESEFIIWAKAFNVLSKYRNELKIFQRIQKTSSESPVEKKQSLLSYVGAGLIKMETQMTSGNNSISDLD